MDFFLSQTMKNWMGNFLGSIVYVGKLFGSLSCGFASEYFGRRNSMILINIPHLIAFALFYFSTSIWEVFVANVLLGFGSGFMKAPCSTYISEIRLKTNVQITLKIYQWKFVLNINFNFTNIAKYQFVAFYCPWQQ